MNLLIVRAQGAAQSRCILDRCMKDGYVTFVGAKGEMEKGMLCLFFTGELGQLAQLEKRCAREPMVEGVTLVSNAPVQYHECITSFFQLSR